jgi:hypothetical protein
MSRQARFKIAGGLRGKKVSWQVTGIRQDAYANAHRTQVEAEKQGEERGTDGRLLFLPSLVFVRPMRTVLVIYAHR